MSAFSRSVTAVVPAKINLALTVGPLRPDGFHEVATVFQAVGLHDEIEVRRRSAGSGIKLTIEGEDVDGIPLDETNLAWRAADLIAIEAETEPDIHIHIRKFIPVAGGMAGGSADAAGALLACDLLWRSSLSRERLEELAAQLGSDVVFCLHGGTAVGTGRGERVTAALTRGQYHWVFALADEGLSTPAVYAECDRLRAGVAVPVPEIPEPLMEALLSGDPARVGAELGNDLQPAAVSLRPQLDLLLEIGRDYGALGSIVSGSGPTCAYLVKDEEQALDLAVSLAASGLCRTVIRASGPVHGARLKEA